MNTYKVFAYNRFTGKIKVRRIEAENVLCARCSHKAVSNKMMANGWYVCRVDDMAGSCLYSDSSLN